ncbi:dTDP-glucose 4,6-dehydratase [Streptomyces sp. NPDC088116]|uniref:dTDP-glucose 4,6-dehydratase n=1 Tax=Streptomyces sp. NPDC088116 TaxID=3365825 RepID=UPI0038114995
MPPKPSEAPRRILVTGGAGFIGSRFVTLLLDGSLPEFGHPEVTVLDALTYAGNLANLAPVGDSPRLRIFHGDICDRSLVTWAMAGADLVVHFAAESHVDRSIQDAGSFVRTNVLGTQTLLQEALKVRPGRFVHVSTDEVYGSIPRGSWTEDRPLSPNSPYAASKASSDLLTLAYHRTHQLPVCVTRCSNNYGPYQYPEKIIPLFTAGLLDGGTVPLYGDGENRRDWLHVDDHCRAIALVALGGRPGEVYNVGGGTELTNAELTDRLLKLCGADRSAVRQVPDRKGHDRRYSVDFTKISTELGYAPRVDIDEGLADTVRWYRENRAWWEPLRSSPLGKDDDFRVDICGSA